MRSLTLFAAAAALLLVPRAEAQCTGTEGVDFERVTIREINAIPQSNVDFLVANAATLTPAQILENITANPLVSGRKTVEFTAYVQTNPYNSGLASINTTTGRPNRIHVFVRDTSAASQGAAGMGIQVVDDRGDNSATLNLFIGDEITVCGTVAPFNSTQYGNSSMQIAPISITPTGNAVTEDDPVLDPITISTEDIHNIVNNATQIDWSRYADFNGQYVRFENIEVVQGVAAPTGRPDVLLSSPGTDTQINTYDTSLRYRNDRSGSYPNPPYNTRASDDPFTPPPTGTVDLQGFLVYAGDDGAFNYSSPARANFVVNPFDDEDFEIAEGAPIVTLVETAIPSPSAGAQVEATVVAGTPSNTITSVVANYTTSAGGSGSVALSNTSGDTYAGTITGLNAGDFVSYTVTATDNAGQTAITGSVTRRVVDGPVSSIFDVQVTATGGPGGSGLVTSAAVAFDLGAVVQSTFASAGEYFATIQDDATLGPFTGVWVSFGSTDPGLAVGDQITISMARVEEDFDVTQLKDVTFTKTGSGAPYIDKVVTTAMFSGAAGAETAEQYEGMVLYFDDATIVATNADAPSGPFGEFSFSTEGGSGYALRADDLSDDLTYAGQDPDDLLNAGEVRDFIRGPLYYSFGNYKLAPSSADDIGDIVGTAVGTGPGEARVEIAGSYPNPTAGTSRVRFELATAGEASLRLFDLMGREVAVVAQGTFSAGAHDVTADLAGLAAGVYVLRLEAAGDVATARIAVVR